MHCESDGVSRKDALCVINGSHWIRRSSARHCGHSWKGKREIGVGVRGMRAMEGVGAKGGKENKAGGRDDILLSIATWIKVFRGGLLEVREEGRGVVEVCHETMELIWDGNGREEEM